MGKYSFHAPYKLPEGETDDPTHHVCLSMSFHTRVWYMQTTIILRLNTYLLCLKEKPFFEVPQKFLERNFTKIRICTSKISTMYYIPTPSLQVFA